jgi:hypothetical protein
MRLVESRVLPYIAGYGDDRDLDDLIGFGVEQAKVRFRANAWGLGTLQALGHDGNFDAQLYVWGRPYFVTEQSPDDVAEMVLRYNRCTSAQVDNLAMHQLSIRDPQLPGRVQPDMAGTLAPDQYLAEELLAVGDEYDDRDFVRTAMRKTDEALALAARIGGAFVEAAEIYIPMEGKMN